MSKKTKDKIDILFCGKNSDDVTGSCIYIETPHRKIVLECGMYQSCGSKLDAWKENTKKFNFKAKDIDYLFVCHCHVDHVGNIPLLYKRGGKCPAIFPHDSKHIVEILWRDSAHIIESDAEELSKKFSRIYDPYYDNSDVDNSLNYVVEYSENEIVELDEFIKFRFSPSGHIVNGCQLELWITENNVTKKILYTSDLGNEHIKKDYVEPLQRVEKADIVIGESTYAGQTRVADEDMRQKDIAKLHCVIEQTCVDMKNRILIPSFALDRTQNILTILYKMFGNDDGFSIPIYVDSPMAQNVCRAYSDILSGENLDLWKQVMSWKNIHFVGDYLESRALRDEKKPCIVIASSGFLVAGRSLAWLSSILPIENDRVVFVGYAPPGSIAYTIKNMTQKTISISGKKYNNRCQITVLGSFSSHMQRDSLLDYYSSIDCQRIYLVHGDMDSKIEFSKELQEKISEKNKTSRVVCVNKGMEVQI